MVGHKGRTNSFAKLYSKNNRKCSIFQSKLVQGAFLGILIFVCYKPFISHVMKSSKVNLNNNIQDETSMIPIIQMSSTFLTLNNSNKGDSVVSKDIDKGDSVNLSTLKDIDKGNKTEIIKSLKFHNAKLGATKNITINTEDNQIAVDNNNKDKNNKIAICFAGLVRSMVIPKVHWSARINLFNSLSSLPDTPDPDLFLYLDRRIEKTRNELESDQIGQHSNKLDQLFKGEVDNDLLAKALDVWKPYIKEIKYFKAGEEEVSKELFESLRMDAMYKLDKRRFSMWFNRYIVWNMALAYEKKHGIKYDWFVMGRVDVAWAAAVPPIQTLDKYKITVSDIWGSSINDQFAIAPRDLAYRMFDIEHLNKYWCIGGPDTEGLAIRANKHLPTWTCQREPIQQRGGWDEASTDEVMSYCCETIKGNTAMGLSEHIFKSAAGDCLKGPECGNNDVGFKDVGFHRISQILVRSEGGPQCVLYQGYQASPAVMPHKGGSRPSRNYYFACLELFRDCGFPNDGIDCEWDFDAPQSKDFSQIIFGPKDLCLHFDAEASTFSLKICREEIPAAEKTYGSTWNGKVFRHHPGQLFIDSNDQIRLTILDTQIGAKNKYGYKGFCLTRVGSKVEAHICMPSESDQKWEINDGGIRTKVPSNPLCLTHKAYQINATHVEDGVTLEDCNDVQYKESDSQNFSMIKVDP